MAQIRVSEEAAEEIRKRAVAQRRTIVAVVDLLIAETADEPERVAS